MREWKKYNSLEPLKINASIPAFPDEGRPCGGLGIEPASPGALPLNHVFIVVLVVVVVAVGDEARPHHLRRPAEEGLRRGLRRRSHHGGCRRQLQPTAGQRGQRTLTPDPDLLLNDI